MLGNAKCAIELFANSLNKINAINIYHFNITQFMKSTFYSYNQYIFSRYPDSHFAHRQFQKWTVQSKNPPNGEFCFAQEICKLWYVRII